MTSIKKQSRSIPRPNNSQPAKKSRKVLVNQIFLRFCVLYAMREKWFTTTSFSLIYCVNYCCLNVFDYSYDWVFKVIAPFGPILICEFVWEPFCAQTFIRGCDTTQSRRVTPVIRIWVDPGSNPFGSKASFLQLFPQSGFMQNECKNL